ncbi:MAG: choice-of-anchor Q domain-containing protein, partial [Pirellulaceae bacterium]
MNQSRNRSRRRRFPTTFEQLEARRVLATYLVDTLADSATGSCVVGSGSCSLRVALDLAATSSESNRIEIPGGTYLIDSALGTLSYSSTNDLELVGTNANTNVAVIDAQKQMRIFDFELPSSDRFASGETSAGRMIRLENLTLQNAGVGGTDGLGPAEATGGGAISSSGFDLTLQQMTLRDNVARGGNASAIGVLGGNLSINNSVILDNMQPDGEAAIELYGHELSISLTTFQGNTYGVSTYDSAVDIVDTVFDGNVGAAFQASNGTTSPPFPSITILRSSFINGVQHPDGGTSGLDLGTVDFLLENVTVSGNTSDKGAINFALDEYGGSANGIIRNSTIAENVHANNDQASGEVGMLGSDITGYGGSVSIESSIFTGTCQLDSSPTSLGNNLDAQGTCGLIEPSDLSNVDPMLGPLQDNGGPVPTHALLTGSPAIDAAATSSPITDARGVFRPQDGDGDLFAEPDIGAFELEPGVQFLFFENDIEVNESDGTATFRITLDSDALNPFDVDVFTIGDGPYSMNEMTLSFDGFAGETKEYTVTFNNDSIVEDDESLTIVMSNPTDPNVDASATATLTIRDDDTATLT